VPISSPPPKAILPPGYTPPIRGFRVIVPEIVVGPEVIAKLMPRYPEPTGP
jgi:hypothetical protein